MGGLYDLAKTHTDSAGRQLLPRTCADRTHSHSVCGYPRPRAVRRRHPFRRKQNAALGCLATKPGQAYRQFDFDDHYAFCRFQLGPLDCRCSPSRFTQSIPYTNLDFSGCRWHFPRNLSPMVSDFKSDRVWHQILLDAVLAFQPDVLVKLFGAHSLVRSSILQAVTAAPNRTAALSLTPPH
jgi:hypothetical protein